MNRIACIVILLWSVCVLSQARNTFEFSGTVTDSLGHALPYVQVRILPDGPATLTDIEGRFTLRHTRPAATLRFSLIGYEERTLNLKSDEKNRVVVLNVRPGELNPVAIQTEKIPKLAGHTWDYDFLDEYILVLQYRSASGLSRLSVINNPGQEVSASLDVPPQTRGLFRDCVGNVHLLGTDSVSQIRYEGGKLRLEKSITVTAFETYVEPCVAYQPGFQYMRKRAAPHVVETERFKFTGANLDLRYYRINRLDQTQQELLHLTDTSGLRERRNQSAYKQRIFQTHSNIGQLPPGALPDERDLIFSEKISLKDIFAPLMSVRDTLYVFDMLHARLLCYNNRCEQLSALPVNFQNEGKWIRNILKDAKTERVYTVFLTPEGFELREIDLHSGNTVNRCAIPYPYIENLKVQGGYVYFIYRSSVDSPTLYLSRIRLG